MEEQNHCVIIVGAGLAGLACAKYLMQNGFDDFILLEAHEQIGGRCQSIPIADHCLELGAEWLDGEVSNNPLVRLADDARLADVDDDGSDRDECYHDEDAESIDEDIVDEMRQVYDEILEKKVPTYPYENYPDLSLGDFLSAEFEQYFQMKMLTLESEEIDERRKVLQWLHKQHPYLNSIACNNLTEVSVQGWNSLERLPKHPDHQHDKISLRHGFENFLRQTFNEPFLLDRLHCHSIVKRISVQESEQYVEVQVFHQTNDQMLTYRADHVVCTQSIGCLKQSMHQVFVPALPHTKRMSIQRLGFGTINKIYLVFSQPFWDVDFDAFHFLWDHQRLNNEWTLKSLSKTSFDSRWCKSITGFLVHRHLSNVLVTEISGEAAKYIENIPDDLLSSALQELLCQFYPDNPSPKPEKLIRSRWFNEPFIFGSHTFVKLGSSIHDIKQLALPWPNKPEKPLLLFAGEGTHERFYGTAHGAYMTGIREGKRIVEFYKANEKS